MMDMNAKNQLLQTIIQRQGYHLLPKKEKTKILDEYCELTNMNRKYVINKIRKGKLWPDTTKIKQRKRKVTYDAYFVEVLIKCWEIFEYPCGQRLAPLLKDETDKLIKLGEIKCSSEIQKKLKKISPKSIDIKLRKHKEKEHLKQKYNKPKNNPLLYQKIITKLSDEWDRLETGNIQIDNVEHCGNSAHGHYGYTVSSTDIFSGWWEGECTFGNCKKVTTEAINRARKRFPINWKEIHTDNGSEYINDYLYTYTQKNNIDFSRSRPYKKNDNCFIEQKNWTHVRKMFGYYRYDTIEEINLINNIYRNELRLLKNFFQPVMKLISKERIKGKIKRKYDTPKTPYRRLIESKCLTNKEKQEFKKMYESLNPAELKRELDKKFMKLYQLNKEKRAKFNEVELNPKGKLLKPTMVSYLITQQDQALVR